MKKIVFFFLVGLLPVLCLAQRADDVRFEMIKETIDFLAKDTRLSRNAAFVLPCKTSNTLKTKYSCLEVSITETNFIGAGALLSLVQQWDNHKEGNNKNDLIALKAQIINNITTPVEKKGYRRSGGLDFKGYETKLNTLIAAVKEPAAAQPGTNQNSSLNPPNTTEGPKSQVNIDSLQKQVNLLQKNVSSNLNMTYATLGAVLLSLVICFFTYKDTVNRTKGGRKTTGDASSRESDASAKEIKRLQDELNKRITTLSESVDAFKAQVKEREHSVKNQLAELGSRPTEILFDQISNRTNSEAKTIEQSANPFKTHAPQPAADSYVMYAKYSDVEGGGFSAHEMNDKQNGERAFEISIIGDRAVYGISNDPKAQRYALQNFEYLNEACNVKGIPQSNARINTSKQGTLSRSPEGDWIITDKAAIEIR